MASKALGVLKQRGVRGHIEGAAGTGTAIDCHTELSHKIVELTQHKK